MRGQMLVPAALVALLLAESHAWVAPPRPRPSAPAPRPPTPAPRPPASRPPVGRAKPEFRNSLDAARARSATEAAAVLRTQGALISRRERAAMLNLIAFQMLRQKQTASLAELRQLRSDWHAVGTGVGLDPIVAMELEAAESAAERLLLAEILKLIADGRFADAHAKLDFLESPRYLPAVVVQTLPDLRMWLQQTVPFVQMQAALKREGVSFKEACQPVAHVARDRMPPVLSRAADVWRSLEPTRQMLLPGSSPSVSEMEAALKDATSTAGVELANKLRVELAAKLFLLGRSHDAEALLESDLDPVHAAAVLADLRTAVLGRGEIITPQVARFVPPDRGTPSPASTAILPPEQLAKWKPPARKSGETTIDTAIKDAKERVNIAVHAAVVLRTAKVNEAAGCVRAALAAEAEPMKAFLDKLEVARGKPFASDVERHLAIASATRGLTVAETAGVLAADADRPAVAARLLANVPAYSNPGAFALTVEMAGRAPAAFAAYPDAGFKLTGAVTRARLRDAVAAVLNTHAAKVVAELAPPPLDRAALEAEVAKRLGVAANAIPPVDYVQALLDTCRDWAEDHVRLKRAVSELNDAIAILEAGGGEPDEDTKDVLALAKTQRIAMQLDRKRREAGVMVGCRLLGEYGKAATSAHAWLREQMHTVGQPWREDAENTLKKLGAAPHL